MRPTPSLGKIPLAVSKGIPAEDRVGRGSDL